MKPPLYVRELTPAEREALEAGLHSQNAFTLRRGQILFTSADGEKPSVIAKNLKCATQTVRNVIHDSERHTGWIDWHRVQMYRSRLSWC